MLKVQRAGKLGSKSKWMWSFSKKKSWEVVPKHIKIKEKEKLKLGTGHTLHVYWRWEMCPRAKHHRKEQWWKPWVSLREEAILVSKHWREKQKSWWRNMRVCLVWEWRSVYMRNERWMQLRITCGLPIRSCSCLRTSASKRSFSALAAASSAASRSA